jgi:hypothetical protein
VHWQIWLILRHLILVDTELIPVLGNHRRDHQHLTLVSDGDVADGGSYSAGEGLSYGRLSYHCLANVQISSQAGLLSGRSTDQIIRIQFQAQHLKPL